MFCKNCGHEISDDAKFCSNCGTKVEVDKDIVVPVAVVDKTEEVTENNVEETLNTTNVEQSDVEVESVNENESTTSVKEWYYVSNNDSKGSFSIEEMKAKITSGEINGSTLVWKASMKDWERLENTELNEFISTSSSSSNDWYYVENNDSKGPFSESDMKGFIDNGVLTGNSFVWKTGMQDWQRLKNTELAGNETVHVEPSFSFAAGVVKEKSIGLCVVLSLVTCGIYSIYWLYTIAHDLNDLCESQNQEKGAEPGLVVVLSIVTCGIYLLYYLWKAGKMVSSLTRSNGHHPSDDSIVLMVLSILQLSLVSYCILQSHINGFAKD
ncbi:GYF domain-containing protein [Catenibacterium faecis]|uniref:GYF domain-containing protein n=1 Tax=Catenibacterium faecis TaxID=2764323 RepID=UPI003F7ED179